MAEKEPEKKNPAWPGNERLTFAMIADATFY